MNEQNGHEWEKITDGELLWEGELDKRYRIEVRRESTYIGTLRIFDKINNNKKIAQWSVSLTHGAKPEVDLKDVHNWQRKVMTFIDNFY